MEVRVMTTNEVKKYFSKIRNEEVALLSIMNFLSDRIQLKYAPDFAVHCNLEDASTEDKNKLLSREDEERICDFLDFCYGNVDLLIVQCERSNSYSSALAAACLEYTYESGITIFCDERYNPNKYVYNHMLEMLREGICYGYIW